MDKSCQALVLLMLLILAFKAQSFTVEILSCAPSPDITLCDDNGEPVFQLPGGKNNVSIPPTTDPLKQPKAPTAPSTAPITPQQVTYFFGSSAGADNACAAAALAGSNIPNCYTSSAPHISDGAKGPYACSAPNNCSQAAQVVTPASCPSGYSVSGNTCNLSDARLAKPDNKQDFKANNASPPTYTPINDADSSSPTKTPTYQPNPQTVQIPTKGTSGNPQQGSATISPTGTTYVIQKQITDGNGNSYIQTTTYVYDTSGNLIGGSVSSSGGSMVGGGTGGTYTSNTSGGGSGVQFPNDYARTGEADAAATKVVSKVEQLRNDLKEQTPADGSMDQTSFSAPLDGSFTSLLGWNLPLHNSVCPSGGFDAFGHTFQMSAQCQIFDQVKPQLQAASLAGWFVIALLIVLGA